LDKSFYKNTFSKKTENFSKKVEDMKQLEKFLGCLTYDSDFVKDLAKPRKPLQ